MLSLRSIPTKRQQLSRSPSNSKRTNISEMRFTKSFRRVSRSAKMSKLLSWQRRLSSSDRLESLRKSRFREPRDSIPLRLEVMV
jgi:hypothetical protein